MRWLHLRSQDDPTHTDYPSLVLLVFAVPRSRARKGNGRVDGEREEDESVPSSILLPPSSEACVLVLTYSWPGFLSPSSLVDPCESSPFFL